MLDLGKDAGIESGIERRCLTIVSTDPRLARSRLFIFPGVRPDWRPRSPLSCGLKSASTFPGGGRERLIDYRGRAPRSAHAGQRWRGELRVDRQVVVYRVNGDRIADQVAIERRAAGISDPIRRGRD
jgi:hypothetical protein